jgi:hypothetical protein
MPLNAPELPQEVPEIVPVTCEPLCWNVAVTVELAHALESDWNMPLQVPATLAWAIGEESGALMVFESLQASVSASAATAASAIESEIDFRPEERMEASLPPTRLPQREGSRGAAVPP